VTVTSCVEPAAERAARPLRVRFADPTNEAEWDKEISEFPEATAFHSSGWCRVLKSTYGFRPCYVAMERDGKLCGVLPVMEADSWAKGRRGISLPFTDECSALVNEPLLVDPLIEGATAEGMRRRWNYLECRGTRNGSARRSSLSFHGHAVDLEAGEEELFKRFDSAAQRAIRKATRSGLTIEITTSLEAVRSFFGLHCKTRRKHGVPPQPFAFFENIYREILTPGHGFVAVASLGARPVSAAIFFHFGKRAIYKFGASDERVQHLRGNNLVMWEAIRWLVKQNFSELDLGRTSVGNEGLRRFKLSLGASESLVEYWKYDLRKREFVEDRDHASGWHAPLVSLLPVSVLRGIGKLMYRHLA
jgi:hypothetical protein